MALCQTLIYVPRDDNKREPGNGLNGQNGQHHSAQPILPLRVMFIAITRYSAFCIFKEAWSQSTLKVEATTALCGYHPTNALSSLLSFLSLSPRRTLLITIHYLVITMDSMITEKPTRTATTKCHTTCPPRCPQRTHTRPRRTRTNRRPSARPYRPSRPRGRRQRRRKTSPPTPDCTSPPTFKSPPSARGNRLQSRGHPSLTHGLSFQSRSPSTTLRS